LGLKQRRLLRIWSLLLWRLKIDSLWLLQTILYGEWYFGFCIRNITIINKRRFFLSNCVYSRKFSVVKINYQILDKEPLAVVDSFEEWRYFLQGSLHQAIVYKNYKNLEYFMFARLLNCHQACSNMSLSHFDFIVTHQPKKTKKY